VLAGLADLENKEFGKWSGRRLVAVVVVAVEGRNAAVAELGFVVDMKRFGDRIGRIGSQCE
jgi:hypothetical protein